MRLHLLTGFLLLFASSLPASDNALAQYGNGTAGTGGFVPRIWATNPYLGTTMRLTLDRATGGRAAVLLLSGARLPFPVKIFDVDFLVDMTNPLASIVGPIATTGQSGRGGVGTGTIPFPLPNDPKLAGETLYAQWLIIDQGLMLAASDALRFTLRRGQYVIAGALNTIETAIPPNGTVTGQNFPALPDSVRFTRSGEIAVVSGAGFVSPNVLNIYDASVRPMRQLKTTTLPGRPRGVALHPDGGLAYIVYSDPTTTAKVGIYDIDPRSARFGAEIGTVAGLTAARGLENISGATISGNGKVLLVSTFRFVFGGTTSLVVIDVDPASSSRNRYTKQILLPTIGGLLTGAYATCDGRFAYAASAGDPTDLVRVNLSSGAIVNTVRFASDSGTLKVDPRERFLIYGHPGTRTLQVVNLEPGSQFFNRTTITLSAAPAAFELNPDGSQIVAAVRGSGLQGFNRTNGSRVWSISSQSPAVQLAVR